jgi:polygalacturonase
MIKRLTLLKIAILTCVACSTLDSVNGQPLYKNNSSSPTDKEPAWVKKTGARKFPSAAGTFSVNKYGAKGDGQTLNTKAIQSAFDACAAAGGGVVVFVPGSYVTGSLFVKSNVQLRLYKEMEILGSQDFADYPEIDTRVAGIEMKWPAALINNVFFIGG